MRERSQSSMFESQPKAVWPGVSSLTSVSLLSHLSETCLPPNCG